MPVPVFVGAGTGAAATTGTLSISKTGCTGGGLLFAHMVERGNAEDWGEGTHANIEALDGLDNDLGVALVTGSGLPAIISAIFVVRALANGTCTAQFTVGASGNDLFGRMYEFSGASLETAIADVCENGAQTRDVGSGSGDTEIPDIEVVTNGAERLAVHFLVFPANTPTVGAFTGESGGDWTEPVAEFASGTGTTVTMQIQIANVASATTFGGGTVTVGPATDWGAVSTAIIPTPALLAENFPRVTYGRGAC